MADAILDAVLERDADALVGCEVTVCRDKLHIMGEITSSSEPDYEAVARETLVDIGYTTAGDGFDADHCTITVDIHSQSPDITRSVERMSRADAGAGDQGIVYGFACDETDSLMPLPYVLAHALARRLDTVRKQGVIADLRPDGKAQISVEYNDDKPKRVESVIISAQHAEQVDVDELREQIAEEVIRKAVPVDLLDDDTLFYVNPTGRFVDGGPSAKAGLSGRKTSADTYGGCARWGGSSLVGKDGTKVNRSGAFLARYLAKNIVAAHLARKCEVRLAYAIGLADPVCVSIGALGTGTVDDERLTDWALANIDMRPSMIIKRFKLRRPIYHTLSCFGCFGKNAEAMPWEQMDLAPRLVQEIR